MAIPRFCTYCGSEELKGNEIMNFDGIECMNCGMKIHDCCTQTGHHEYKIFKEGKDNNE